VPRIQVRLISSLLIFLSAYSPLPIIFLIQDFDFANKDIETVLRVLNNDRLTSKINAENFDVDVKHKIGAG